MSGILRILLRVFSIAFNLLLGLLLFGIGMFGWATGEQVRFEAVPGVEGETLVYTLLGVGFLGVLLAVLAPFPGRVSSIFLLLWSLLVVSIFICDLARSSYRFEGTDHLNQFLALLGLALLALGGSWFHWRAAMARAKRLKTESAPLETESSS